MSALAERRIVRALVFDPRHRLFLIAYVAGRDVDPRRPGLRRFWFMPGGGIEDGETEEEALRRELDEEIGVADAPLGPPVGRCEGPFLHFRTPRFARESYRLVHLPSDRVDTSRLEETEDSEIAGTRWWDLDALAASGEIVEPPGLVDLARRVAAGDRPPAAVHLNWSAAASGL